MTLRFPLLLSLGFLLSTAAATLAYAAAPLSVDDAIRLALQNNQRLKVSVLTPAIARANVLAAYGAFDPVLTFRRSHAEDEGPGILAPLATRSLSKLDSYTLSLDGLLPWGLRYSVGATARNPRESTGGFADNYATFGGITVTQPLLRGFGFGANLASLRVARASRDISDWQHRQTVIDTVTNVIFVFNNLQQARDNVRIARLSRDLAAQLLADNQRRNAIGALSDADVTQARARVANREESILFAERSVRDVENQLRLLVGDTAFQVEGGGLDTVELAPAAGITVNAAADLKRAYELRPDYQAARLGLKIDRANEMLARNQLLPEVDFVGSYGYRGLDADFRTARSQVREQDARSYAAEFVVRIPLTFSEGRGRARAARLNLRRSEADLAQLEQEIAVSVAAAAGQIDTTKRRVAATRVARDFAEQALEAERKKLQAGSGRTLDVLSAQEQLSSVQNSHARALADERRAIANYERELGITLLTHHIEIE